MHGLGDVHPGHPGDGARDVGHDVQHLIIIVIIIIIIIIIIIMITSPATLLGPTPPSAPATIVTLETRDMGPDTSAATRGNTCSQVL